MPTVRHWLTLSSIAFRDWGCPDRETVVKRMKAKTNVWMRMVTEKQDPQYVY